MRVVCFVAASLFYGDVPDKQFRGTIMEARNALGGLENARISLVDSRKIIRYEKNSSSILKCVTLTLCTNMLYFLISLLTMQSKRLFNSIIPPYI
jgi:hypothetical protein